MTRPEVLAARRVVVKVGSSSVSGDNAAQIDPLVDALAAAHARGTEVVLVSSGAIATAIPFLNLDGRPTDLATQQAAAAVGQNVLMWRYQTSLDRYRIIAGYSRRILPDVVMVADFIREQQPQEGMESNIVELGFRYQFDPQTVVGAGVGAGIGDDSPPYRLLFGISRSF